MFSRTTIVCGLAALVALSSAPRAQEAPSGGTLRLDVAVVDSRGVPVADVRPAEFEVWISGYRVPVRDVYAFTPASRGRTIVLLLDDMGIGPQLAPRVRQAAKAFVERMEPGDRIAVVPVRGGQIAATDDRAALLQAIDRYYSQSFPFRPEDGSFHVLRTLQQICSRFAETVAGRKAIVAIGAGWLFDLPLPPPGIRERGDLDAEWVATMRAMAQAHASLYVIDPVGLQTRSGPAMFSGAGGFAGETGGYAFLNTNDHAGAAARIMAESGTYYELVTDDPPVAQSSMLRRLEVKVLRDGVTVRSRKGIKGRP